MDSYFQLYHIPESFSPDAALVRRKFYELSRLYHPDHFTNGSAGEQAQALQLSALNNEAYNTLSHPESTMAYILKLHGLLADEEKYGLPPAFLMEMMELNELVSDSETDPGRIPAAKSALQEQLAEWESAVKPLKDQFNTGDRGGALLERIKDYYFRHKYLLRIQGRLDTFAG